MDSKSPFLEVHFFNQALNELGHSYIGEYLFKYLNDIKAGTILKSSDLALFSV
jgi:hypothetical protein